MFPNSHYNTKNEILIQGTKLLKLKHVKILPETKQQYTMSMGNLISLDLHHSQTFDAKMRL